jgi:hypothetical protein
MGKSAERAERLGIRVVANRERPCGQMSHEHFCFRGGGGSIGSHVTNGGLGFKVSGSGWTKLMVLKCISNTLKFQYIGTLKVTHTEKNTIIHCFLRQPVL